MPKTGSSRPPQNRPPGRRIGARQTPEHILASEVAAALAPNPVPLPPAPDPEQQDTTDEPSHAAQAGAGPATAPPADDEPDAKGNAPTLAQIEGLRGRKTIKPERFFAFLATLPETAWQENLIVYIYRHWPVIDRTLSDPTAKNYIDKQVRPFTETHMLHTHGSGMYELILNDSNRPKGSTELCRTFLQLNNPEFPPVVDPREVVLGHPKNQSYEEYLRNRGRHPMDPQTAKDPATAALANIATEAMRERRPQAGADMNAFSAMLGTLAGFFKQQTDPKSIADLVTAVTGARRADEGGASNALLPLMVQMMQMQSQTSTAMIASMIELVKASATVQASAPTANPLAFVEQTLNMLGTFRDLTDRGPGRPQHWSTALVETLPGALGHVATITGNILHMKAGLAPNPAGSGTAPVVATPEGNEMLNHVISLSEPLKKAMAEGWTGIQFAEWIENGYGRTAYQAIANLGPAQITALVQRYLPLWQHIAPIQPQFAEFLQQFMDWPRIRDNDLEDPYAQPTAESQPTASVVTIERPPARKGKKGDQPA